MKFLADECCDAGLVNSLREAGHDVAFILERKAGIADEEVLFEAYNEGRILITEDKSAIPKFISSGGNPLLLLFLWGSDPEKAKKNPFAPSFTPLNSEGQRSVFIRGGSK